MNKVKSINQDEAEKIANLNFSKINEMYRIAIYNELNKKLNYESVYYNFWISR